jgi:taurine dioxygenase
MMSFSTINVKPISGYVGAEIHGINLKKMSKDQFEEIKIAFGEYGVIFFRDQNLSPQEEINFAEHWGKININRFFSNI